MALSTEDKALLIGAVAAGLVGTGGFLTGNPEYGYIGTLLLSIAAALKAVLGKA